MATGNVLVGQSGGPTSVINSSLAGVVDAAIKSQAVGRVLGMRFGIEGVLNDFLVDLGSESVDVRRGLRSTPGSALGSSRLKLQEEHFPAILRQLKKYNIRYYFMIGGNDTMDTIHRVTTYAGDHGHEMVGVGVPKTVDNDLYGTDHTPGYPSAARRQTTRIPVASVRILTEIPARRWCRSFAITSLPKSNRRRSRASTWASLSRTPRRPAD